jgi:hypothetical protein
MGKAADGYALPEFLPAIKRHQLSEHISQSDSVKWIVGLRIQCLSWFKENAKVINQEVSLLLLFEGLRLLSP